MRKCFFALCNTSREMGPTIFHDRPPAGGNQASAQTPKEPERASNAWAAPLFSSDGNRISA